MHTPDASRQSQRCPVSVVLEDIRSLYNVGSIFRTSDGAGIEKLYLCGYTGHPPRKEIDKTALGSVASVPWERRPNQFEAVRECRALGCQVVALERAPGSAIYTEARYRFPLCLVLGNEVRGISDTLLSWCDMAVHIPMHGIKESLNVTIAYGIVVYHLANVWASGRTEG